MKRLNQNLLPSFALKVMIFFHCFIMLRKLKFLLKRFNVKSSYIQSIQELLDLAETPPIIYLTILVFFSQYARSWYHTLYDTLDSLHCGILWYFFTCMSSFVMCPENWCQHWRCWWKIMQPREFYKIKIYENVMVENYKTKKIWLVWKLWKSFLGWLVALWELVSTLMWLVENYETEKI